ncbi:MAG: Abi-alpha family protein [Sporichthyaceae bacterium]
MDDDAVSGPVVNGHRRLPLRAELLRLDTVEYRGLAGIARFAVGTGARIAGGVVRAGVDTSLSVVREVGSGVPPTEIVERRLDAVRRTVVHALGLPDAQPIVGHVVSRTDHDPSPQQLREQGDALLRQIGDPTKRPHNEHPAFSRILHELMPDEARIVRFMALAGPQPAIDVRTRTPLGVGSELIACGINLIAEMSGCTHPDHNAEYLANLDRLGMIAFSNEQVDDPRRYSFVEAQPVASAAMAQAKRTVTVYRSVRITEFGLQFANACFTLDGYDAGGWTKDVR